MPSLEGSFLKEEMVLRLWRAASAIALCSVCGLGQTCSNATFPTLTNTKFPTLTSQWLWEAYKQDMIVLHLNVENVIQLAWMIRQCQKEKLWCAEPKEQ